jgi:hypothetical protein
MAIRFSTKPQSATVPAKGDESAPATDGEKTTALTADGATDLFEPDAGKQAVKAKARKRK